MAQDDDFSFFDKFVTDICDREQRQREEMQRYQEAQAPQRARVERAQEHPLHKITWRTQR